MTPPVPERLAEAMVGRLRSDGYLHAPEVADAFRAVPRHQFVPDAPLDQVYDPDRAIVTRVDARGVPVSSSSAPNIMARMLERLGPEPGDRVLEIGTGTGYNAALLATLVTRAGSVTSIDIDPAVTGAARPRLERAGFGAVRVLDGDGWLGSPQGAPYDRIEATVGLWDVSPHWLEQLRDGGTLVLPLWLRPGTQVVVAFERRGDRLTSRTVDPCGFMRLRGPHAGPEEYVHVGGWAAALEHVTAEQAELLAALLEQAPVEEELGGELPEGWFARLAFEATDPILLSRVDDPRSLLCGLFDREAGSLALVADGRVLVHGGDAALRRLRDHLPDLRHRPLDVRSLRIEAVRAGARAGGPAPGGGVVLPRPSFDLLVTEPTTR